MGYLLTMIGRFIHRRRRSCFPSTVGFRLPTRSSVIQPVWRVYSKRRLSYMTPSEIEPALPEPSGSLALSRADESDRRFANLRGVRWRVNLGVLPSFASPVDEFRRATANSRRRLLGETKEAVSSLIKAFDILRISHGTSTPFMKELSAKLEEARAEASYKLAH